MKFTRRIFLWGGLLLAGLSLTAQMDLTFDALTGELSRRSVKAIVEDSLGFMWFGTIDAGIYRFDGINSKRYHNEVGNTFSLPSNAILDLQLDADNVLWVATDRGVLRYDRTQDRFVDVPLTFPNGARHNAPIRSLMRTGRGELLAGSQHNGLFVMATGDTTLRAVPTAWNEDRQLSINDIEVLADGSVLLASNRGLLRYDRELRAAVAFPAPVAEAGSPFRGNLLSLQARPGGGVWLGAHTGEVHLLDGNHLTARIRVALSDKRVLSLERNGRGGVFVGTENGGLYDIDASGTTTAHYRSARAQPRSLSFNSVWAIHRDRAGRLWIGYFKNGVSITDPLRNNFSVYQARPGQPDGLHCRSITGFAEDGTGRIWITSDGEGLDVLDPRTGRFRHVGKRDQDFLSGLEADNLMGVTADRAGNIWVATWGRGVFFLPAGATHFRNFTRAGTAGKLPSDQVMYINGDDPDHVYFATFGGGIASYDATAGTFDPLEDPAMQHAGLIRNDTRVVVPTHNGSVWIGSTNGLYRVVRAEDGRLDVREFEASLIRAAEGRAGASHIISLYEAEDGRLWIGTDGAGLYYYDAATDGIVRCELEGLEEPIPNAITEDTQGNLWIGGSTGLTSLRASDGRMLRYRGGDGLLAGGFSNGAVHRTHGGHLYFGSYEGILHFNPLGIKKNPEPPRTYLRDFKLFNQSVDHHDLDSPLDHSITYTDALSLSAAQSMFTIEYAGISMTYPQKNQYAYRLVGYDEDWQYVGGRTSATYMNLPPGDYVFKAKAANNDGLWGHESARLAISVSPPWYRSSAAWATYALLLCGGILLVRRFELKRYRAKQQDEMKRERRVREEELHEQKLRFFTNISHEFRTPLTLIINPLRELLEERNGTFSGTVRDKLAITFRNADKLSRLVDELLSFRQLRAAQPEPAPRRLNLHRQLRMVADYFQEEADRRSIELTVDSDQPDRVVKTDPGMLEKILFNLISNAFKATKDGGRIVVQTTDDPAAATFGFFVRDDGVGLAQSDLSRIYDRFYSVANLQHQYYGSTGIGLEVVKTLVEIQGGRIEVASQKGEGATFTVHFPWHAVGDLADEGLPIVGAEVVATPERSGKVTTDGSEEDKPLPTHKLLVVEDNAELRDYLQDLLKKHFQVLTAGDGREGHRLARERQPDIILTDVVMPEMDGLELCAAIKGDVLTSHIPLLMLTARTQVQDRLNGIDAGADSYLTKPFDAGILVARLQQLIGSRQLLFEKFFRGVAPADTLENTTSVDAEFLASLVRLIRERMDDSSLSVELLSAELFMSRSHLYRKTKALTGLSVNQLIRKIRLEQGKELLSRPGAAVKEVAFQVGFSSPSYFAKCFKQQFGCLPTDVLQQA